MLMRTTMVVIVILVLGAFAGCGDDDKGTNGNGNGNNIPSELVATWTFESATVNGDSTSLVDIIGSVSARITISAEGSYVFEALDSEGAVQWSETGTFSVSGNGFTLTDLPILNKGTWAVSGNQLTLTVDMEDHTVVITAIRMGA